MPSYLPEMSVHPEVAEALHSGRPVVALESTLISHGLPYPHNLQTARAAEAAVRASSATPATIAILGGQIRVGLDDAALEHLAEARAVHKVSRRDLAAALALGWDGATTVATTMVIAHRAGIRVFATGGIGGVHRGAVDSMDISADLTELARTPVLVVCAGAKAILDLPLTLQRLETLGVPVLGYQTDELPAFYYPASGLPVDARVETAEEVARVATMHWHLDLRSGLLLCVPIPADFALERAPIERAIAEAVREAERQQVRGGAVTPFLLGKVRDSEGEPALRANIALITHNAGVAAQVACLLPPMTV